MKIADTDTDASQRKINGFPITDVTFPLRWNQL